MRGIRQTAMLLGVCAALGAWVQGATREDIDAAVARITKGVTDDTGRARKLLEAVQTLELQRDLVVGILDRAVECATQAASDPDAFQAGLDALDELERKAPDRKAQWAQKRVALSRRAYEQAPADKKHAAAGTLMKMLDARGDRAARAKQWPEANALFTEASRLADATARRRLHFEAKQRKAAFFQQAEEKIANLKSAAARRPDDARTRQQLLESYLVHLDAPQQAKRYLTPESSQAVQTYLPMVLKRIEDLPETGCVELAEWYEKSLAAKAPPEAKEAILRRARRYGQRALELHSAKDLALMDLRERLKRIDQQLAQFGPVGSMLARLRYVDLTALVDLDLDATEGSWLVKKGTFCTDLATDGALYFPVKATGSYRLALGIAKAQEAADIKFTFAVGEEEAMLSLHEFYKPASEYSTTNVTWIRLKFERLPKQPGTEVARIVNPNYRVRKWAPYAVDIAVKLTGDRAEMAVGLNRRRWLFWKGTTSSLARKRRDSEKPFSVQYKTPGVVVSSARLRPVDGEVVYLRDEAAKRRSDRQRSRDDGTAVKLPPWQDFK